MSAVGADDGGAVFLVVMEGDLNLLRVGDDVVIGEDVSGFVDDETGSLALLRVQAVEEVEGLHPRRDVDYGGDVLAIDADVVLFFGVEPFAAGRFGDFNVLRTADPVGGLEPSVAIGGEVEEGRYQNNCENKRAEESHWGESLERLQFEF